MSRVLRCALVLALWFAGAGLAAAQELRASLRFEPPSAAVGERVRAILRVQHAQGAAPTLSALAFDDSWAVFDNGTPQLAADGTQSTWEFELAALEPGDRSIAEIPLLNGADKLSVDSAVLKVRSVLAPDENAPRALHAAFELELNDRAPYWTWVALGALALLFAALAWRWSLRRKPATVRAPAPSTRLAILESRPLDTPADVQAAHFALTRLLREAADLRLGTDRSGLTDEEWRLAARVQFDAAGLAEQERAALEALLERASAVKYGSDRPTHWATREALASARALAARLEPTAEAAA